MPVRLGGTAGSGEVTKEDATNQEELDDALLFMYSCSLSFAILSPLCRITGLAQLTRVGAPVVDLVKEVFSNGFLRSMTFRLSNLVFLSNTDGLDVGYKNTPFCDVDEVMKRVDMPVSERWEGRIKDTLTGFGWTLVLHPFLVVGTYTLSGVDTESGLLIRLLREGGIRRIFSGFSSGVLATLVYCGLTGALVDLVDCIPFMRANAKERQFYSACAITTGVGLLTYPFDTLTKTCILSNEAAITAARRLYSERGIRAFYSGLEWHLAFGLISGLLVVAVQKVFSRSFNNAKRTNTRTQWWKQTLLATGVVGGALIGIRSFAGRRGMVV